MVRGGSESEDERKRNRLALLKPVLPTMGFKIGLELMVRCGCSAVVDVPITFQERVAGESKLTMKQNVEYVRQLRALYVFKYGVGVPLVLLLAACAAAMRLLSLLFNSRS